MIYVETRIFWRKFRNCELFYYNIIVCYKIIVNFEFILKSVILAKAGIHKPNQYWIPTFVGMTLFSFLDKAQFLLKK